ncbi:MAG TPA: sialidase family protein [bacterium]|nr:sialidase family protein [bacterium]
MTPRSAADTVVHRDPFAYCSHPSILELATGEWLIAFMESMRRAEVLHSPADPRFYNVLTRSVDQGRAWSAPMVAPGYDWYGVECPSLTRLSNGDLLLFQWRWRWRPWSPREGRSRTPGLYERAGYPWARGNDGAYVHRSRDEGYTWEVGRRIDTAPYEGAYTIRSAAELPDGTLLFAVTDIPRWRQIYLLRSGDGGATWSVGARVASAPDRQFSEPALVRVGGRLVALIREVITGFLYQAESDDGGVTWTEPRPTRMWGSPPHVLDLGDDRLLCVYGHRRLPYSIRGCVSPDGGRTWDIAHELTLRGDLPNANLGYPSSVLVSPGLVFTAYYGEDAAGVTCIQGTQYSM